MTNHTSTDYIKFEDALDVVYEAGQFWELHPDCTVYGHEYDDEGNIVADVELTLDAAITDMESSAEDGSYRLWGTQFGDSFNIEANIDGDDTLVRLVDAR
jgi:hypothetical protein